MAKKKLDKLIEQMENYLECWKQFNRFVNLARTKKFKPEDEDQFLEVKSIIVQELEFILASIEAGSPSREEVHALVGGAPSLRFLGEMQEGASPRPGKPVAQNLHRLALHPRAGQSPTARGTVQVLLRFVGPG